MAVLTPAGFPTTVKTLSGDCTSVYTLPVLTTDLDSASDFYKLAVIPAGYRLVGFTLGCAEELDTGTAALTGDIGLLNAAGDGLVSNTTIAALTTSQTGSATGFFIGTGSNSTAVNLPNVKNTGATDAYLAIDFTAAANVAAAGTFVVTATITPI